MAQHERLNRRVGSARTSLGVGALIAALVVELMIAPITFGFTAVFAFISWLSRWRPLWLTAPLILGVGSAATIGAARALAGFLAPASRLISILGDPGMVHAHPSQLFGHTAWGTRELTRQIPVAMIIAVGQARIAGRFVRVERYRPGLIVGVRCAYVRTSLRRGEVATPDGGCLGLIPQTGRRATISWREARSGVLIAGSDPAAVTSTGLDLVTAAIRHRKAVIIIDLSDGMARSRGDISGVAALLRAVSADHHVPLAIFDADRGNYDPFTGARAERSARLVTAMIDWTKIGADPRLLGAGVLTTAFELVAASGLRPHAGPAGLDELARVLLSGGRPQGVPGRDFEAAVGQIALGAALSGQLRGLRSTALGTRLSAPRLGGAETIDLSCALAERDIVLYCLDRRRHGWAAAMVNRLVIEDLLLVLAERAGIGAMADCLAWVNGCEACDIEQVAGLLGAGAGADATILIGTASGEAARRLAGQVNVLAIRGEPPLDHFGPAFSPGSMQQSRGQADPVPTPAQGNPLAAEILFTAQEGEAAFALQPAAPRPDEPALGARSQQPDDLTIRVRAPRPRLVSECRAVR